tara:strand:+ start:1055 stop:1324 length:270 start_codon:yes stop_codon:yes gene_type:complete
MSLETVEEDLNYYKPVIKKYSCLRKHIYIQTIPENFNNSVERWSLQKDLYIDNFITFIVVEFMRGNEYIKQLGKYQRLEIESYTTRRLQ